MAEGWDRVAAAAEEARERQEQWDAQRKPQLWPKDGGSYQIRFLEQEQSVKNYAQHEYSKQTSRGPQRRRFTCLNDKNDGTKCPGCDAGLKIKIRGVFNVIQRQRPVLRRGADGKAVKDGNNNYIVDGHQDEVVIIDFPSTTANMLRQVDADMGGLMSRDVKLSRTSGNQFQPYLVMPADMNAGAVPMSEADFELAKGKHDLDEFMQPPSFVDAAKIVAEHQGASGQQPVQAAVQTSAPQVDPNNPFGGGVQPVAPPPDQAATQAAPPPAQPQPVPAAAPQAPPAAAPVQQ